MAVSDQEFLSAFEACAVPNESFHHRDHIRLAWVYLEHFGDDEGYVRMADAIRRFATHAGKPEKYHHTVTLAWMRLVAAARRSQSGAANGSEFVAQNPDLLHRSVLLIHYSPAVIDSEIARRSWVEPDLAALP